VISPWLVSPAHAPDVSSLPNSDYIAPQRWFTRPRDWRIAFQFGVFMSSRLFTKKSHSLRSPWRARAAPTGRVILARHHEQIERCSP
jgi:hypothetical protein